MKILYILSGTNSAGGATKSAFSMIKTMRDYGCSVTIVLPNKDGIYDELCKAHFNVIVLPFKFIAFPKSNSLKSSCLLRLRKIYCSLMNCYSVYSLVRTLKNDVPDIIHSNVSVIDIGYRVSKLLHIPHVYHFREYCDKDFALEYVPSWNAFHEAVISNSSTISITKDIQKHHGITDNENNIVLYNGLFNRKINSDKEVCRDYFLYAGRIENTKGLHILLHAYNEYIKNSEKKYPLKVAGHIQEQQYYDSLKDYISSNHLQDYVEFLGEVLDMDSLYSKAKALVISSLNEGFGRCMPEAMYNKCLCIGYDNAGTKEQFENGLEHIGQEIGYRYTDLSQLTDILLSMDNYTEQELDAVRDRAFYVVNELYSIEHYCEHLFKFYKNIINQ